jgi:hypothetical protein
MELDLEKIQQGIVRVRIPGQHHLGLHWNDDPQQLGVWVRGQRHDWGRHRRHLYLAQMPDRPRLHAEHGSGKIFIEAGASAFASAVDEAGRARFLQGQPAEVWEAYTAW